MRYAGRKQESIMPMRADKDFRTYEQALTVVQRFGELAEEDHKKGRRQEAQYNLSHATFVGVKHLLFMAADAAVDRMEARELASKNHLAVIELLSLTLASLGGGVDDNDDDKQNPVTSKSERLATDVSTKAIKVAKGAKGAQDTRALTKNTPTVSAQRKKAGLSERRR